MRGGSRGTSRSCGTPTVENRSVCKRCLPDPIVTNAAVERIVDDLADATFSSVTGHERHETTDVEEGVQEGQIAEGFGYTLDEGERSVDVVLVFDDADAVDEEAVSKWADEKLENASDLAVSTDENVARITGDVDTDALGYTTAAFYPFQFADGSARSDAS